MAMVVAQHRESSSSGSIDKHLDSGKYVRYTAEQVEALERVYAECPKPSSLRRQQLIRECPILSNIEPKQIKVWFQNRRCREKQRKEASRLQTVNRKLTAMNKLLMEENDRLQKQVSQLVCENGFMRQQLHTPSATTTDASCDSVVTTPQHTLRDASNPAGLLSIAEETLTEFLSKATGTAVDWVQMPGMKPGPDSVGIFAISQSCSGVAARACGLVSLEPTKIAEILKDRPSWFRDCRSLEVFTMFPAGNGGTIELVYTQKMTIAALRYIRQIAQETSGEVVYGLGRQPAVLRTFSQRLSRGFNDAVNGFNDDGWTVLNCDGAEDVIIAVNSTKNLSGTSNPASSLTFLGGILCAKASMLLQNVPPAVLVRFLREHRSEWADFNVDAYSAASLKAGTYAYPGMRPTRFTGSQIIMPLGHTIEHEEMLEVIRLEGHSLAQEDAFVSRDIHLLQICSGIDENAVGACSELVFAPIDEMFPDDAPLVPSGFRIIPLDSKPGDKKDAVATNRTLDLTSGFEVGPATTAGADASSSQNTRSVLTIAFQFPFDSSLQDNVAVMARQYVRSVISSVQRVAMAISPSGINPSIGAKLSPGSPEAVTLAHWICQSYSYYLGSDLLRSDSLVGDMMLKQLWHHQDAILCCSLKSLPVFIFANQAGLDMLETTLVALQDITLDKIFDEAGRKALCTDFAKLMEQGFAYLPAGICMSTMGRHVSYDQAIAWKVLTGEDNTVHCLAFSFINWSFV
ncbi:hypothetical protein AAZV13_11G158900 [Glycine max]